MFRCRACEVYRHELTALRAQLNDLHDLLQRQSKEAAEERKQLLDRLLAQEKPAAFRELMREPRVRTPEPPGRPNLPGARLIPRPPTVQMQKGKLSQGFIGPVE